MSINYRTILPSSLLGIRESIDMNFKQKVNENMTLKVGAVLEIIEIEDELNQSKLSVEYNVLVIEDKNTSVYKNCMAIDSFGGMADYFRFKRRTPDNPEDVKNKGSLKDQKGSIVLLLCLDGSAEQAIVIGALAHPQKKEPLSKEKGHHLEGEFNGLNWEVNKDGALVVTFKSATNSAGEPQDKASGGSTIKMEKDGSIQLDDAKTETIRVDKTKQQIDILSGKNINQISKDGDITIQAVAKNINVKAKKDLINTIEGNKKETIMIDWMLEAQGKAVISIATEMQLEVKEMIKVKTKQLQIKAEIQTILESNIVLVNGKNQITLNGAIVNIGPAPSPAVVMSTLYQGVSPFLGLPVISQAIGPFSQTVNISS